MKTRLTKGLEEDTKNRVEVEFKASTVYRDRVRTLLKEDEQMIVDKMVKSDPTSPGWATEQAILVAELKALRRKNDLF